MNRMRCQLRVVSVAVAGLASTACTGSLLDSEMPVNVNYVLASAPAPAGSTTVSGPALQADLSIGRPDVVPGLDTPRIAVLRGRQLDYYRGARWGGNTTEIVQALLVSSLQDQRLFRSVTAEQARVAGDYVLDIEVRDFQAEYTDGNDIPAVRVSLVGRLIRIADRQLVATLASTAQRNATDNRLNAVVAAFESAAQQVALELAQKTAETIAADSGK